MTAFIAVSRFIASTHARHGIDATVFPNFVDPDEDGHAPRPGYDERTGIVFLGRLRPEKGALDVVELAHHVPGIPVRVVGSGSLEGEIRRAARSIPNLEVVGFVAHPGLRDVLRRARVVVVPSRWQEPGPLVPLEAMAEGAPVVAYAMGGLGEYVSDSGGGRVVPLDVVALANAARELHESRELWERLSRRGLEAIAERHTRSAYGARLERLYEDLRLRRPA